MATVCRQPPAVPHPKTVHRKPGASGSLCSLILPRDTLRLAFHGLHTDDRHLRGTALEYLVTVLPEPVWGKAQAFSWTMATRRPGVREGARVRYCKSYWRRGSRSCWPWPARPGGVARTRGDCTVRQPACASTTPPYTRIANERSKVRRGPLPARELPCFQGSTVEVPMPSTTRKTIDCRKMPSERNCSISISGTEASPPTLGDAPRRRRARSCSDAGAARDVAPGPGRRANRGSRVGPPPHSPVLPNRAPSAVAVWAAGGCVDACIDPEVREGSTSTVLASARSSVPPEVGVFGGDAHRRLDPQHVAVQPALADQQPQVSFGQLEHLGAQPWPAPWWSGR